jgi:hypothetical protein
MDLRLCWLCNGLCDNGFACVCASALRRSNRLVAGIGGSNPAVGMDLRLCWLCSGLSDELIARSEEYYRLCVCARARVCVCVCA